MTHYNLGKPYAEQVKPFGFMVAPTALTELWLDMPVDEVDSSKRGRPRKLNRPKPISPYERDPEKLEGLIFDRETGEQVSMHELKSYAEALGFYHLSPEDKFENGGPVDRGLTRRRRVVVSDIALIGKEANKVGAYGEPLSGQSQSMFGRMT